MADSRAHIVTRQDLHLGFDIKEENEDVFVKNV